MKSPHTLLARTQNDTATLENSLAVAFKMKHVTTLPPATALLGLYPREMEICVHTKNSTQSFIEALFIIGSEQRPGNNQMSFNW